MSKVRNLLKNGAYIGIMNIVSRASGLILNIFLVRMLTTDSFGLFLYECHYDCVTVA